MNPKRRLMTLLPILLLAAWLAVFGDKTPSGANVQNVTTPVVRAQTTSMATSAPANAETDRGRQGASSQDDAQISRLLSRANPGKPENTPQVDLFPGPAQENAAEVEKDSEDEDQPAAPQQPFALIGRMFESDRWVAFLERNGQTHVAQVGSFIDGYHVDSISAKEIRLTQLANKSTYLIPLVDEKKESAHD